MKPSEFFRFVRALLFGAPSGEYQTYRHCRQTWRRSDLPPGGMAQCPECFEYVRPEGS